MCENLSEFIIRDITFEENILHVESDIEIDICSVKDVSWWIMSHHLIVHSIQSNI